MNNAEGIPMQTIEDYLAQLSKFNMMNFPSTIQSNKDACGPAAVKSVLSYYGMDETEESLANEMKTDGDGTTPKEIITCFINRDFEVDAKKMTVEDLEKYIENKIPVIICIQAWAKNKRSNYSRSFKDGHYVVVTGVDEENFYFNDPSLKTHSGYIKKDKLESRWHDMDKNGKKYIKYGIAVFGKNPKFQNNLIKSIK
jgi:predicted double-glycine peptidase